MFSPGTFSSALHGGTRTCEQTTEASTRRLNNLDKTSPFKSVKGSQPASRDDFSSYLREFKTPNAMAFQSPVKTKKPKNQQQKIQMMSSYSKSEQKSSVQRMHEKKHNLIPTPQRYSENRNN